MNIPATILICLEAAVPNHGDCTPENARIVIQGECLMGGQVTVSQTILLGPDEYIRTICRREKAQEARK